MNKRRNKFIGKEDISQQTIDSITTSQIDRLHEISALNAKTADRVQESVEVLYNQSIKVDTEEFEKLSRQFIQQMEYKLKKVKRPSNGLKWYIAMWIITLLSAFIAGYYIQESHKWGNTAPIHSDS